MLKGINKRVIIIKNPESEIFEEAYFIIKSGKSFFKQVKENEMVTEANRIISDYSRQQKNLHEKNKAAKSDKSDKLDKPDMFGNFESFEKNGNNGNIIGITDIKSATAEIDKFLNNKIQNLEKPDNISNTAGNKNMKQDKPGQKNNLKSYSVPPLTDSELFEDEKFFDSIKNPENNYTQRNSVSEPYSISDKIPVYDSDYYGNALNCLSAPIHDSDAKFKLVSSKKIKRYNIAPPPKSFFAGVGFMSVIIIAIRVFEFIFSK